MAIVFFGTPVFAVASLEALAASGEEVALVVTRMDAPRGRDKRPMPPPVKEAAIEHGIRVIQPRSMRDEGFVNELKRAAPEFLAVVAYGRILTDEILAIPSIAPVNLHASLLPKYRGASPIAWALINGERETGVTTMLMARELDAGDILLQQEIEIADEDTTESLSKKLSLAGAELLVKTLKGLRDKTIRPVTQRGEPTFAPPLKKQDGLINWQRPAAELFNFVRGMHPWPGAYCFLKGQRIGFLKVRQLEGKGRPGIIEETGARLVIGTAEGLLEAIELQPEGKRPMSVKAFLQGRDIRKGEALG